jgi:YhcH/YjgK/YiaL family protein
MAIIGSLAAVWEQVASPDRFAPGLACVDECLRSGTHAHRLLSDLGPGDTKRIELPNGAFALLQAYLTKPASESRWETHRAYIDVQAVVEGEEHMETADVHRLKLHEDLTPERDVLFYHPFSEGSVLRFSKGVVGLYFPADAHRGGIAISGPVLVRKVVIKVPVR